MCCCFRFFLSHSFSNQSENCLTGSGSKCYMLPGRKLLSEGFSCYFFPQSSESKFIIRFCQFNGMKTCVTNRKGQSIREYVRRPWNEVWWEQSLLRINNILTLLFNACPSLFQCTENEFCRQLFSQKSLNLRYLFRKKKGVWLWN